MPKYVYPPRPRSQFYPNELPKWEKKGTYVAQRKFNGTRSPIHITADRKVFVWGRHGEPHKQFNANRDMIAQVLALDLQPGLEYWLDGELLNKCGEKKIAKTGEKEKIVLYDVLCAGKVLFGGPDQMTRLKMLAQICRCPTKLEPANQIALVVSDNIWMAETWDSDFVQHFEEKKHLDEIEGLFLRKKKSVIYNLGTKEYECDWCIRCRKAHAGGLYDH